ncbi:MAG: hypothetical protein ACYCZR_14455 [Burkholderiales bacterium]
MTFRIGGEFEISSGMLSAPVCTSAPSLPKRHVLELSTGRAALRIALNEILRRGGSRRAWLPAYICHSVVSTLADEGFETNFYATGANLDAVETPSGILAGDTFLFAHYFGRTNHATMKWLAQSGGRDDLHVIEDCVQASLNVGVGVVGDYAVTSYRKFLPQPDGALLGADVPIESVADAPDEAFVSAKFLGKLLRQECGPDETYLALFEESENRLDMDSRPRSMSRCSAYLMARTDIAQISHARRSNWDALSGFLHDDTTCARELAPLYGPLEEGEVPLGYPVRVSGGRRNALRRHLASKQIYCPVHWALPHLQDIAGWEAEKALSESVLTLPVDQRLGEAQLEYMVRTIASFFMGSRQ